MNDKKSLLTSPQLAQHEQHALALSPKQVHSLYKRSKASGIPLSVLEEIYNRGFTAAVDNKPQSGFARVDSFIHGGEALLLDRDLMELVVQEPISTDPINPASRFIGTDQLVKVLKNDTPGEPKTETKLDIIKRVVKEKNKESGIKEGVKHVIRQMAKDAVKAAVPQPMAHALTRYNRALKKRKKP